VDQIAARCTEVETGARNIDYIMTGSIMPRMSQEILSRMGAGAMPTEVRLDLAKDGTFNISFKGG
jgi:type VI secretion system protein VasG